MKAEGTLRGKLLRLVMIPLLLVAVVDVIGSYVAVSSVSNKVYDFELNEIARELLLHVVRRDGDGELGFDLSNEAERMLFLDEFDTFVYAVRTEDGDMVSGDYDLARLTVRHNGDAAYWDATLGGKDVRIARLRAKPFVHPVSEPVLVYVAETRVKRSLHQRQLLLYVILPQLALILLAGSLVWMGVSHGLGPLRQLQAAVTDRSHLDLSPIAVPGVPREVQPLVSAVNDLMTRIDGVLGFQGRFIADTAHQLRTPVAGLKAHIEVALRERDHAQVQRALGHIYTSAERLSRLVSQLLSLARNEPDNVRNAHFVEFDLDQLALETTQEWVPHAYKKDIDLGFESAGKPVMVLGEPARLTELINNLVDNAIRYTPDGGRVTVSVAAGEAARLIVRDDGKRIPLEERERIFQRFHRLLGTHEEGSGLGLAIVHEIAVLHDATITLEDDADGVGNTFTVSFPFATSST